MRDLLILAVTLWGLSKVFSKPHIGIYLWTWFSLMNPHRMAWGFAYSFPFAQLIGAVALISLFTGKQKKLNVWSRETVVLFIFIIWICITTLFAIYPSDALKELERFIKIQIFIFMTIALISDKKKLDGFIWVIVASIGFFGVKGGIFTIANGGSLRVWGPPGSFIEGNNELALAILMVIPLMNYLRLQSENKWVKRGLIFAMIFSAAAVLGSQSRGAFLGIMAIGLFFWLKSNQKLAATLMVGVVGMMVLFFMPQTWWDRMNTIQTYEEDGSAMGRINAWWVGFNVANDRITGGGAGLVSPETFREYAPRPEAVHDFHSIYFEVLGEQGWVGLTLFLILALLTWQTCGRLIKLSKNSQEHKWASDLMPMLQVGLIGYYVAGAFLGLAYYDLYYNLIAIAIISSKLINQPVPTATTLLKQKTALP